MTTTAPAPAPVPPTPRRPRTLRTVLLVVGSVFIAALLALVAVQVIGSSESHDQSRESQNQSRTSSIEDTFDRVTVHTAATDVVVEHADVDQPQLVFAAGDTTLRETHSVRDGELIVDVDEPAWSLSELSVIRRGAHLTLRLPTTDAKRSVTVTATAADVDLRGSYEDVTLTSAEGDITIVGTVSTVKMRSTQGDAALNLSRAPSSISLESTSGDQDVRLPTGRYAITTETTVGDVTSDLKSSPDAANRYRFTTTVGDIELSTR